jgi:hypothetical protein
MQSQVNAAKLPRKTYKKTDDYARKNASTTTAIKECTSHALLLPLLHRTKNE